MQKINLLFKTSRPVSWVNTAYPFAAGYLLLGGQFDLRLILGTIFFLIPYNLLMYGINDVFDYESDIRNPRKGGVEGAVTPRKYHPLIVWSSILISVPFVVALVFMGTWLSLLGLVIVLFFVIAYSAKGLRFKEKPVLDSITSSIHFVGPLVYAFLLVGATPEAWVAAGSFFLWGMASHAFGAVQDIVPDREGELHSIATVFGAKSTVRSAAVLYTLAALGVLSIGSTVATIIGIALLGYSLNVLPFWSISDKASGKTNRGWRRFLWLNYLVGAIITMSFIYTLTT